MAIFGAKHKKSDAGRRRPASSGTSRWAFARAALAIVLLSCGKLAMASDDWLGGDKRAHFISGLLIGGVFSAATGSRKPGVLMGCSVGVFGELIEAAVHQTWDHGVSAKDFGAQCAGGVAGAYVGYALAPNDRVTAAKDKENTSGGSPDTWTGHDKFAHFAGGVALSGLVSHLTDSATAGVLTGCGVAAAGELISAAKNGWHSRHVSAKDFAVGCLGAVTAGFVGVQLAPGRIVWTREF